MVLRLTSAARALCVAALSLLAVACVTTSSSGYPAPRPSPTTTPSGAPPSSSPAPPTPYPYPQSQPAPAPSAPSAPRADPSVTLALREQSVAAAARGDHDQAVALIERALRIEPSRPELWIDLARLHLEEGDKSGAEQFARKALLFTKNRPDLEQQAYTLISNAQRLN